MPNGEPASPDPSGSQGGLTLGFSAAGTLARLTLRNTGPTPLRLISHVDAGERHYDPFVITLVDVNEVMRTLRFIADRNESARVVVELAPGADLEHEIDLAAWALRPVNGGRPLAGGAYDAEARYQVAPEPGLWSGSLASGWIRLFVPNAGD